MKVITDNTTFKKYKCSYDWPQDCFVQCGSNGVVLNRKGTNYMTAYFEAFPKNPDCFIRGEGKTLELAEQDAYNKFLRFSACNHDFERTENYYNGMGTCKHCGMMKVVFEPTYKCICCGNNNIAVSIRSKYKSSPEECLCKNCYIKKDNFHYISDRSIEMLCNHKNGILLLHPIMDKNTFQLLLNKPSSLDEFFDILNKDSNEFLYERMKRLLKPLDGNSYNIITSFDDLYNYFYENYMIRWIEKGFPES